MRIVVDTNIVFSGVLNTDSKIARIILQPKTRFNFYSTEQLLTEINQHKNKIKDLSNYSDKELDKVISLIVRKIRFVNLKLIPQKLYNKAEKITSDVDIDDCEFVALTEHIKGSLWTGDKNLIKGLTRKNWMKFVSTEDLYKLI